MSDWHDDDRYDEWRADAIAEQAYDLHVAVHVDADYFDPDCGDCQDDAEENDE